MSSADNHECKPAPVPVVKRPRCCLHPNAHADHKSSYVRCEFCKGKIEICRHCYKKDAWALRFDITCDDCLYSTGSIVAERVRFVKCLTFFNTAFLILAITAIIICGGIIARQAGDLGDLGNEDRDLGRRQDKINDELRALRFELADLRTALDELKAMRLPATPAAPRPLRVFDTITFMEETQTGSWHVSASNGQLYRTKYARLFRLGETVIYKDIVSKGEVFTITSQDESGFEIKNADTHLTGVLLTKMSD